MGKRPHVVIIGAGFGGVAAAKKLAKKNVDVTITDNEITSFFRTIVGEGWTITIKQ